MLRVVGRLLLAISCLLALPGGPQAEDPELPTTVHAVEGLSAQVEILLDRWGVPHIYAESLDDVFFAQGWNAARDRLWQLDVWKRRGDGTLAEVFGPEFVEKDRAARHAPEPRAPTLRVPAPRLRACPVDARVRRPNPQPRSAVEPARGSVARDLRA
jgi:acyl-homoserine lactone acylase PvdQ